MKVILIDDEQLALNYLEHQLLAIGGIEVVGKFTNPIEGRRAIESSDVDLVFLDIHIPEINGLELGEQLLESNPHLQVVFVTAYNEYAVNAFELNALDYVLKPANKERLQKTVKRLRTFQNYPSLPKTEKKEKLQICLFKQVRVYQGKEQLPSFRWRTAKVEQLFLYLVRHNGQIIQKTKLIEMLWSELDPKKASQQLYTAIYHIRKTLGSFQDYFQISSKMNGYSLLLIEADLDIEQFESFLEEDKPLNKETITDYERILNLVNGEYLEGYDYIWVESDRYHFQLQWFKKGKELIKWYYENKYYEKAYNLCLVLIDYFPLEEELYFDMMKISNKLGMHNEVRTQYSYLQEIMVQELNEKPSKSIVKWYEDWERKK